MKRSFKVATVFSGVGAMTGIFAPAALAAPAHTAAPAEPAIGQWQECGANNNGVSNWVHIYYPNNDHPAECIGGAGFRDGTADVYSFCPGNNSGRLHGRISNNSTPFSYKPGQGRHEVWYSQYAGRYGLNGAFHMSGISNFTWSKNHPCT